MTGFRFRLSSTAGLALLAAAAVNGQTPFYTPSLVLSSVQVRGLAVDAAGRINVLAQNDYAINVLRLAPQTSPGGSGVTTEVVQANWNASGAYWMVADTVGNVYIDNVSARIVYENFPAPEQLLGPTGPGGVALIPDGVAVDRAGQNIYIIDAGVSPPVIRLANAGGKFLSWSAATEAYVLGVGYQNIAVDYAGNLYFAQPGGKAYDIFRLVPGQAQIAVAGYGASGLCCAGNGPAASADFGSPFLTANLFPVADNGIYVADCLANQIYRVDQTAAHVTSIYQGAQPTGGPGIGQGAVACGINPAVDAAGRVYFVDGIGQIWQLNPSQPTTSSPGTLVSVTVGTNPSSALPLTVDGATYSSPQTFQWAAGGSHTLGVPNTIVTYPGNGTTRVTFNGWNQPLYGANGNVYWVPTTGSGVYSVTANVSIAYIAEPQTITFAALPNVTLGVSPITLSATASSGLTVSYVSTTTSVCTASGSIVAILGVGTCSITASQSGNSTWAAAPSVTQSFTVSAASPKPISITNVATFVQQVSPGALATIFGNGNVLAATTVQGFGLPLPSSSNGTSVTMNGILCPLLYLSPAQINVQTPMELQPGTATVVVNNNGKSFSATVLVLAAGPGFFTTDSYATGGLAIVQDSTTGALRNSGNPATPGEYVTMYFTGIGPVTNNPGTGNAAGTGNLLPQASSSVGLTVNGAAVQPLFVGLTPGFVGLGQLNFQVPASTPSGNAIPVLLTIGGVASKTVVMSVSGGSSQSPVIASFAANPGTVQPGQSSTLNWSVSNATSLTIDNGIGTVTGNSLSVTPQTTTTYKLTATNASGAVSATATVTVSSGAGATIGSNTVLGPNGQKLATGQWNVTMTLTSAGTNGNDNGYQITGTATWVNVSNCDLAFTAVAAADGIYYYIDLASPGLGLMPSYGIGDSDSTNFSLPAGQTRTYSVNDGFEAQNPKLVYVGPWFNEASDASQLAASGIIKFTSAYGQCTSSLP